ncbi:MAG: nitroreductase [Prevotella sp.]|nr:nitroreductase [Prevotella sp.]
MTLEEAIKARHSVRAYREQPLAAETAETLTARIQQLNTQGQLHMQLVQNEPKAFLGTLAKYGRFSGVRNYIVMAGKRADDLDERIGYYGEQLVLLAQTLGLNTCWVGLSYTKVPGTYVLDDDEVIKAYISIGYGQTQGTSHKIKRPNQVSHTIDQAPDWFLRGIEAALLAPTAVNQQKFCFDYQPVTGQHLPRVVATRRFSLIGYTQMDLGIAKCHFEIGAGREHFEWA